MGMEINTVVVGGNLARDVEQKQTATGRTVASLVVATNHTYVSNGEKKKETAFIDVEVWGPSAESCAKYLKKGSPVVVSGRLKQDRWESQTGEKRNKLKVVAANVQFLPSRSQTTGGFGPAATGLEAGPAAYAEADAGANTETGHDAGAEAEQV